MSMPKFPDIDPDMTCENALNMILSSIAMQEMALSHIISAEGEKLRYVLKKFETENCKNEYNMESILKVNTSIKDLLECVSQNEMILKSKMEKAICGLSEICGKCFSHCYENQNCFDGVTPFNSCSNECSCPTTPTCPCEVKSGAFFKTLDKCSCVHTDYEFNWNTIYLYGDCINLDPCNKSKIILAENERYLINFSANVNSIRKNSCSLYLLEFKNGNYSEICKAQNYLHSNTTCTISSNGVMIETFNCNNPCVLSLKLESFGSLILEDSMFSVIKI